MFPLLGGEYCVLVVYVLLECFIGNLLVCILLLQGHHPTLGAHQKFTNYAFDVDEFMRIIIKLADEVLSRKRAWKEFQTAMPKHDEL